MHEFVDCYCKDDMSAIHYETLACCGVKVESIDSRELCVKNNMQDVFLYKKISMYTEQKRYLDIVIDSIKAKIMHKKLE